MARYLSSRRTIRRIRKWLYIISALVLVVVVIVFISYRKSVPDKTAEPLIDTTAESEVELSALQAPPEPVLSEAVAQPSPEVDGFIAEAMDCLSAKPARIIEARDRLNELLPMPMASQQRAQVKEQLTRLADKWLFNRTIFPQDKLCGSYQVKPGNLLSTIGRQFKVPYEILMQINNIRRAEHLQAGQTIKVVNGPFHVRIYRSTFTMDLYLQNTFVRSFPVGLGQPDMETPTGLWRVKLNGKLITPTWTDPVSSKTYEASDPDYPLGSRWMGLEGVKGQAVGRTGFAIHGTKDPNHIGTASSQGCIRLHNGDAILLYNLLTPGASLVEIME